MRFCTHGSDLKISDLNGVCVSRPRTGIPMTIFLHVNILGLHEQASMMYFHLVLVCILCAGSERFMSRNFQIMSVLEGIRRPC